MCEFIVGGLVEGLYKRDKTHAGAIQCFGIIVKTADYQPDDTRRYATVCDGASKNGR